MLQWLQGACDPYAEKAPHRDHHLRSQIPDTIFCVRCGAWSRRRHRALLLECPGEARTALCRMALRRFELGLPAPGTDLATFAEAPAVGIAATELVVMRFDSDTDVELVPRRSELLIP